MTGKGIIRSQLERQKSFKRKHLHNCLINILFSTSVQVFLYDWEMQFSSGFNDLLNYHMEGEQHYRSTYTEWKKKQRQLDSQTPSVACVKRLNSVGIRLIYGHKEWQRKIQLLCIQATCFCIFFYDCLKPISFYSSIFSSSFHLVRFRVKNLSYIFILSEMVDYTFKVIPSVE